METRPYHDRLERVVGLATSLDAHRLQLERFYGFISVWEPVVERISIHTTELPSDFWEERRKLPRLEADLRFFGYNERMMSRLPHCTALPSLVSVPHALGSLYVLEGASLGGQIISRHLEQTLGLTGGHGYSFFQSNGRDTAHRWKAFGQTLLDYVAQYENSASFHAPLSRDVETTLVRSASDTFISLERWFAHESH